MSDVGCAKSMGRHSSITATAACMAWQGRRACSQLATCWRKDAPSLHSHLQDASVGAGEAAGQPEVDGSRAGGAEAASQDVPVRPAGVGPAGGSRVQAARQQALRASAYGVALCSTPVPQVTRHASLLAELGCSSTRLEDPALAGAPLTAALLKARYAVC